MSNVPDRRRVIEELLALAIFPVQAREARYQRTFCARFADLAPGAWRGLTELEPLALQYCQSPAGSPDRIDIRTRLMQGIQNRAEPFGIGTDWMMNAAVLTLVTRVLAREQGIEPPKSLVYAVQPELLESEDGASNMVFHPVDVDPIATINFHPLPTPLQWNPLEETSSQFQQRALDSFKVWLKGEVEVAQRHMPVKPVDVNTKWVEWTILRRVAGRSTNSIANQYRVHRDPVDKGINEARHILGFPDHITTPDRMRHASKTIRS